MIMVWQWFKQFLSFESASVEIYTWHKYFYYIDGTNARLINYKDKSFALAAVLIVGTLRNHNGNANANENVAWKFKFALLVLLRDYSNSFNLYNVVEQSSNRTGGNGVQVETEIENFTVMCSPSPQDLEFGHFTLWLGRARWGNVPKFVTHVQGLCFSH